MAPRSLPNRAPTLPQGLVTATPGGPHTQRGLWPLVTHLLADGVIAPHQIIPTLAVLARPEDDPTGRLLSLGLARDPDLTRSLASFWRMDHVSPETLPPDPALIDRLGVARCLRLGLLPWQVNGGITVVLATHPLQATPHRTMLQAIFGRVRFALSPRAEIDAALMAARCEDLSRQAETLTPAGESCRSLIRPAPLLVATLAALGGTALLSPYSLVVLLTGVATAALLLSLLLKLATLVASLTPRPLPDAPSDPPDWPTLSVIVALYREEALAPRLVHRLSRLDYPRDRLDLILAVEEDDRATHAALAAHGYPPWMRLIVVPQGLLRTKPRALNYALSLCRGSIVGVYDAEDAPDPMQLRAVARRFHQAGPQVACLQGILDFYNPRTNWLSRAFTLEYAVWFRLILPGLARLGLPLPLGGTTLFFRRKVLETLGGWDAHNVTEDADLGLRLYRHGYRTELIDSVTEEEANCRPIAWIRQRSRWIKGYMMTWRVHMRSPLLFVRQIGLRAFIAVQVLFLCSLLQVLLAPLLLSLWLISLGLPHPVAQAIPAWVFVPLIGIVLASEAMNLALCLAARRQSPHRIPLHWAFLPHLLQPLAIIASYKALWELLRRPFYWDKTQHGRFT